jgi:serralysin
MNSSTKLALALAIALASWGPSGAAAKSYDEYFDALGQRESSNRYNLESTAGYLGRYQFGESALVDCHFYEGDNTPANDWIGKWSAEANGQGVKSKGDFLGLPKAQDFASRRFAELQWKTIARLGLDKYDGQTIGGVLVTKSGMLGGAHLVGAGMLKVFLTSGGKIVPRDGNGTPVTEYIQLFASYGVPF